MDFSTRVSAGVSLLWAAIAVVIVSVTFSLTAHRDLVETRSPETPAARQTALATPSVAPSATPEPSRPAGVPADAVLVREDTVLDANPPDGTRLFFWLTCDGPLLVIATTRETVYAEVDCSRYWLVHEVVRPYQGQPVRIAITTGPNATLVFESESAGAARFGVGGVWVLGR